MASSWILRLTRTQPESLAPLESPPVASVEEEEQSELDDADDQPVPHVEGTTQGEGIFSWPLG